ncbi:tetratricopeptide repeat protein [Aliiruegeria sabulilitoris]|uniref:tetratricopeptide repeat protein n=1 Tax=Aliiruegeria sabulilitoris TaxID=1510458 RepID=UPI000831B74F|nr:tetratricopeptide repeat protein [Aliiruegeria sabulilitoris]NDR59645.1 tetratricopeptide repeat protein [Pseudoruegeria sp. M32A2M]
MTRALTLRLEGSFEALDSAGSPIEGLSKRGQALLAYLACQPGMAASRSVLMDLLWSDRSREQAGASLRQELSRLRRCLPEHVLLADRREVRLSGEDLYIRPGEGAPLLDGFDLASRGFEDWLRDARLRHQDRAREDRLGQAAKALETGDADAAQAAASAALDTDPASELAMQMLLRAAALGGDRSAALARLERFESYLSAQLDIAVMPETIALAEALRQASPAAVATAPEICIPGSDGTPVLAILPFDEIGGAADSVFADGVVEEITASLSRSRDFHVIARQSSFALRGQGLSHAEIGKKLGATYLLEGSIQRAGDRVRITTRLVLSESGRVIWSDRQDDRLDDLFDLQDRIAAHVAGQLSPSLRSAEIDRARAKPARDRTAYDLVLTAYPHFWTHNREANAKALALFDEALACDPDYPRALAMKAWCHAQQACYLWSNDPDGNAARTREFIARAQPVSQEDPPALVALAAAYSIAINDFTRAEACLDRALSMDPNNAWGWLRKGWNAVYSGNFDAAFAHFDRMEHLSPLDPFHFNLLFGRSATYRAIGRYDEAIALVEKGLGEAPGATWAYRMLFATHLRAGNMEAATEAGRKWRQTNPDMNRGLMNRLLPKWSHDPEYRDILLALWEED